MKFLETRALAVTVTVTLHEFEFLIARGSRKKLKCINKAFLILLTKILKT